ncbi:MAG TPA: fused MFS/spermidine synthase [Actinomycetota bacterium]|jgi:spermidine synthase
MSRVAAGALVFSASAAVLVLEILAVRLLAPYVGVTLETYTAIIGVVLAGISVGSWAGGRLADRVPPRRLLGPLLVLGGALALLVTPIVRVAGTVANGGRAVAVLALACAAFFAPAAVLSAVHPTVVKLQLADLGETGRVVGRLSAVASAGAILGTLVTGFLLLAALPVSRIVLGVGIVLVVTGVVLSVRLRGPAGLPLGPLVLAVAAAVFGQLLGDPCQVQSPYFCARVERDPGRPSGRLLVLDDLVHSYVDLRDPTRLEYDYVREIGGLLDAAAPAHAPLRVLHVGGGGFSLPRYLEATRPGSRSVVLELDPAIVRLARQRLGLVTSPGLVVVPGDARLSLRRQPAAGYDVVIGDAFGGRAVPWHLTTMEFLAQVRRVLRPGGVYAVNLIDGPPLGFVRAEAATLRAAFRDAALVAPPDRLGGRRDGNFVLLASDAPLPLPAMRRAAARHGQQTGVLSGQALDRFVGPAEVLTDDHAPVDQLVTRRD